MLCVLQELNSEEYALFPGRLSLYSDQFSKVQDEDFYLIKALFEWEGLDVWRLSQHLAALTL